MKCIYFVVIVLFQVIFCENNIIYENGVLENGWQDWSWDATIDWQSNLQEYNSQETCQVTITQAWGALNVAYVNGVLTLSEYSRLSFNIFGGSSLQISISSPQNEPIFTYTLNVSQRNTNEWSSISIVLPTNNDSSFTQIWFQDANGSSQQFFITNIVLNSTSSSSPSSPPSNTTSAWWNGLNIPWDNFGNDIGSSPPFNTSWFQSFFQNACDNNDINSARFWIHCDGRGSPLFNSNGEVTGLSSTFISDLVEFVTLSQKSNVVVILTLWSFDMCNDEAPGDPHADLITNTTKTQTYIENALYPMIVSVSQFNNIVWEVINEPEWCISETPSSTSVSVSLNQMQRFVAMIASAIHEKSQFSQKVTVGSSSLKWNSNVPPAVGNWWSNTALQSAYSSTSAYLDFYQVHYYDWMYEWGYDPANYTTQYWELDKPTLVGELPSDAGAYYTPQQFMDLSYDNGFIGTLFWSYNADYNWQDAIPGLTSFYSQYPEICSYSTLTDWIQQCC